MVSLIKQRDTDAVLSQATAYASEDGMLTEEMIDRIVDDSIRDHEKKVMWQKEEKGEYLTPLRSSKDASADRQRDFAS